MIVRNNNKKSNSKLWVILCGILIIGIGVTILVFTRYRKDLRNEVKEYQSRLIEQLVAKYFAQPEVIYIDIKHKNFMKLAYKRSIALKKGILLTEKTDWVPARLTYKNKVYKIKMRLKGDWIDHLVGDKWSFRIKLKGDNTFKGMKEFSIQHPRTRHYIYEWIMHQAFKREGLISLRYDFINVILNGKDLGIFYS